jgi:sulfofructose kinase
VIVTLGERGLIWQRNTEDGTERGSLPAFAVTAVDTTGAGDAFHGALAAGLAAGMAWLPLLRYASAAGALCCTRYGARLGIPTAAEVAGLLDERVTGDG